MMTQLGRPEASLFDLELLLTVATLSLALAAGALAFHWAYRWYRNQKQLPSTTNEDLAAFVRALQAEDELEPEELERVRAALDRQKRPGEPGK
jgi:hypothetical protein